MDALRLLTRGTNIRPRATSRTNGNTSNERSSLDNEPPSKKRKRDSDSPSHSSLPQDEIRRTQNSRKIRIIDLRTLHANRDEEMSRKSQKEQSRLYPQPLTSFAQLKCKYNVSTRLVHTITAQGYVEPTEVQLATIPILLQDEDEPHLLTVAPTGSGKTLAFLVHAISKILKHRKTSHLRRCASAIILAPTKELMEQILNEGRRLVQGLDITISALRKGVKVHHDTTESDPNIKQDPTVLKSDIVIATPLTLVHSITSSDSEIQSLPEIQTLILDEADVLLDPLFRDQTLTIWSACTSSTLRLSFWSATIGASIESLVLSRLEPTTPLLRTIIGLQNTSLPSISHHLIHSGTEHGKLVGFRQLLNPSPTSNTTPSQPTHPLTTLPPRIPLPWLIFTQTITRATALYAELQYDLPPSTSSPTNTSRIAVLHSSLTDTERQDIMTRFRRAEIWLLITTDLLSRGIDFRGVKGVINYDIPTTSASYIHRAGRTGRAGRMDGVCVTFYTKEDVRYLKGIVNVIEASNASGAGKVGKASGGGEEVNGIPRFLKELPDVSKKERRELKERGVGVRRAIREGDEEGMIKGKRKARIGTESGWEKRRENNLEGAKEGMRRRKDVENGEDVNEDGVEDGWTGFE